MAKKQSGIEEKQYLGISVCAERANAQQDVVLRTFFTYKPYVQFLKSFYQKYVFYGVSFADGTAHVLAKPKQSKIADYVLVASYNGKNWQMNTSRGDGREKVAYTPIQLSKTFEFQDMFNDIQGLQNLCKNDRYEITYGDYYYHVDVRKKYDLYRYKRLVRGQDYNIVLDAGAFASGGMNLVNINPDKRCGVDIYSETIPDNTTIEKFKINLEERCKIGSGCTLGTVSDMYPLSQLGENNTITVEIKDRISYPYELNKVGPNNKVNVVIHPDVCYKLYGLRTQLENPPRYETADARKFLEMYRAAVSDALKPEFEKYR